MSIKVRNSTLITTAVPIAMAPDTVIFPTEITELKITGDQYWPRSSQWLPYFDEGNQIIITSLLEKSHMNGFKIGTHYVSQFGVLCSIKSSSVEDKEISFTVQGLSKCHIKASRTLSGIPVGMADSFELFQPDCDDDSVFDHTAEKLNDCLKDLLFISLNREISPDKISKLKALDTVFKASLKDDRAAARNNFRKIVYFLAINYFKVFPEFTTPDLQKLLAAQAIVTEGLVVKDLTDKLQVNTNEEFVLDELKDNSEVSESNKDESDKEKKSPFHNRLEQVRKDLNKEALKIIEYQLSRLDLQKDDSMEKSMIHNWLRWILWLPWGSYTSDSNDLVQAQKLLDEKHTGLDNVKDTILDFLAVRANKPTAKAPILCLAGPPGTGKTSLGETIALAQNRKFTRMALGGVTDEVEIRGHRQTYIGALPGQIIQHIYRAGSKNPVFMLDEVDKIPNFYRGDPQAALMEAMDPEQNKEFRDHYLNVPFDLSQVFFVCTANNIHTISGPLQDRMEIIQIKGYSEPEKIKIAHRHLVHAELNNTGLNDQISLAIADEALVHIIRERTKEQGVRQLQRVIHKICAKIVRRRMVNNFTGHEEILIHGPKEVTKLIGPPPKQIDSPIGFRSRH